MVVPIATPRRLAATLPTPPMTLSALYCETILAHNRLPKNFGPLTSATHCGEGRNASCGDQVRMALQLSNRGVIEACRFEGESCAICTASASMLSQAAIGARRAKIVDLHTAMMAQMDSGIGADQALGELAVFAELQAHPARQRCALLPFDAMARALAGPITETVAGELQFRAADDDDIPAIVALVESAYRGAGSRQGWTTEADLLDGQRTDVASVAALIQTPDSQVLLALRDRQLLGCAQVEAHDGVGYFGMFAVSPGQQGGGIGDQILRRAEQIAKDRYQAAVMTMTVISVRQELIAYYQRRGYRPSGQRKAFPYGDERFGVPKRGDLEFMVLVKSLPTTPSVTD